MEVLLSAFGFEGEAALVRRAGPLRLNKCCDAPRCSKALKLWRRRQLIAIAHSYEREEPIYCFDCWKARNCWAELGAQPSAEGFEKEHPTSAKAAEIPE